MALEHAAIAASPDASAQVSKSLAAAPEQAERAAAEKKKRE